MSEIDLQSEIEEIEFKMEIQKDILKKYENDIKSEKNINSSIQFYSLFPTFY